LQKTDFYRPEYQKRKDKICPFSSLADFNPLQLTKSQKNSKRDTIKVFNPIVKRKDKNMAQKVLLSCSCFN
ncbi:hypothetical protein, partial [Streptococcus pneumoniae]|uniref:hypothetical protein n=1 Tax=Streptococcus pneumoniae TaxID=1313 RepID=UPI0034CF8F54